MFENVTVAPAKAVFEASFYGTGDEGDIVGSEIKRDEGEVRGIPSILVKGVEYFVGHLKTANVRLLDELASEIFRQEGVSYDGNGGGGVVRIPIGIMAPRTDQDLNPTIVSRYWLGQGETGEVRSEFPKNLVHSLAKHESLLRRMAAVETSAWFAYSGGGDDGGIVDGGFTKRDEGFTDEELDALSGIAESLVDSFIPGFEIGDGSCGSVNLHSVKLVEALDALRSANGSIPKVKDINEGALAKFSDGVTVTYSAYGVESEREIITLQTEQVVKIFESVLAIDEAMKERKAKSPRP